MAPFIQAYSSRTLPPSFANQRISPIIAKAYTSTSVASSPASVPAPASVIAKSWPPNLNTDYESLWPLIALRHTPPGPATDCAIPTWGGPWVKILCVARNVYYKGTCTAQAIQQAGSTGIVGPTLGVSGEAASVGISTALVATKTIAAGSAAIPIIGLGISAITSIIGAIFAHHAQAVANEQEAECSVQQICGQAIPQIDAAVQSGQITAAQGITAHQQVINQCKSILAPVSGAGSGGHPCNAGCCFGYWLDCLQDFATTYYPDLTPPLPLTTPVSNGVAPMVNTSLNSHQIATTVAASPITNPPTSPSSAYQASVTQSLVHQAAPPTGSSVVSTGGVSGGTIFLALAVVIGVLLLVKFH